jgi:hypothetical protein
MTDRSFGRILRRYKERNSQMSYYLSPCSRSGTKLKRHYRRSTRRLSVPAIIGNADYLHENHRICSEHPRHRWLECPHGRWCWPFCMGCYGKTCPYCGRQIKVKRRFKSQQ